MEKSSKRGKIPQSDWPLIMERYEAGETLASIARTYDCSPPAISYVVSRSRERQPAAEPHFAVAPAPAAEPQLIKAAAAEPPGGGGRMETEPAPVGGAAPAFAAPPPRREEPLVSSDAPPAPVRERPHEVRPRD